MSRITIKDRYLPALRRELSKARLGHSLGVMRMMKRLAELYGLDREGAMTAGLLHDVARELEPEKLLALAREARLRFYYPCDREAIYLHGPVGAYLAETAYGVTDRPVLEAIEGHSFYGNGRQEHGELVWALRLADLLSPVRDWPGRVKLETVVMDGRMKEAALLHCGWLIDYFGEQGITVHPNLERCYRELSAELEPGEGFFERL